MNKIKRIGILIPYTNLVVENELHKACYNINNLFIHTSRIYSKIRYSTNTNGFINSLNDNLKESIKLLKTIDIDALGYFCTIASANNTINLNNANIPFITTSEALINSLKHLNLKNIILITPYTDELGKNICTILINNKINIITNKNLNLKSSKNFAKYGYNDLEKLLFNIYDKRCDGIVISCTNLPTFHLINKMEQILSVPIITSNQATLWNIIKTIDSNLLKKFDSFGYLFKTRR
ncbi:MAG: hypothetical protein ABF289_19325 [Clostridiales bacterium]